jgi:hypothetical protein
MQRLESGSWREAEQGESQTGQDLDRRSRTIPGAQPIRLMLEDDDEMSAPGEMLTQPESTSYSKPSTSILMMSEKSAARCDQGIAGLRPDVDRCPLRIVAGHERSDAAVASFGA